MTASWPPPISTMVTVRTVCCGSTTGETAFKWDGEPHTITSRPCGLGPVGYHWPSASATWTTTNEVTE